MVGPARSGCSLDRDRRVDGTAAELMAAEAARDPRTSLNRTRLARSRIERTTLVRPTILWPGLDQLSPAESRRPSLAGRVLILAQQVKSLHRYLDGEARASTPR